MNKTSLSKRSIRFLSRPEKLRKTLLEQFQGNRCPDASEPLMVGAGTWGSGPGANPMRARNLKPGFFKNETLAEIEPLGRLLFQGLWCMADREGIKHFTAEFEKR